MRTHVSGESSLFLSVRHPRRLAAAFLDEMCQSADRRHEVESRLAAIALAELTSLPETSDIRVLAAKLAQEARKATLQRAMSASVRGTIEWMKLDQKLRRIEGFPSIAKDQISDLGRVRGRAIAE